ncbi:CPBP family intramembrane metalloprotease [Pyxidicoccus parkwayensis]|uniref:CPBP family intramembrane metalloprotease n=1 Tax=Pyxidicoccus parkwayensis TaxID=2813578 RepID=A0ABX7P618_9BACT|nr:type II CAAX endopeptidase family protein [Pyxidicoccus parkwaysis]QSQ25930.1 CPBP family intramembrane metalloprotease [Pyxidicoccus parkwaysis]
MDEARRARRGLWVFFAVLIALSAVFEGMIILRVPFLDRTGQVVLLMWSPAVASFVARIATREGWADLSFRIGGAAGWRALLYAVGFPLGVGLLAYGVAWATGLATFEPPVQDYLVLPQWVWEVEISGEPVVRFAKQFAFHLTLGAVVGCIWAAGEELGWRGYLAPRLLDARVPWGLALSGFVWALWHLPLMLRAGGHFGPSRLLTALLFVMVLTPMGVAMARLRMETGSMWPPIVLHGVWNEGLAVFASATNPPESFWLGETGILVVAASLLLLVPLLRGSWSARRAPERVPYASFSARS